MKITGVRIENLKIKYDPIYPIEDRVVGQLDAYEEYAKTGRNLGIYDRRASLRPAGEVTDGVYNGCFVVISTDEGIEGWHGPVEYRAQLMVVIDGLASHLIGRDPLENRMIWDIISRFERHSRSGIMMMAISTVDNALWDLKGKILGQPVYKLLGGGRNSLKPYVSALGFSTEPERVRERAAMIKNDLHIGAQKWFFPYGPASGLEGMKKNIAMAQALRETVGDDYPIMFDCWMGWDIPYAKKMFRELEPLHPSWIEEVLRPHYIEAYKHLRQDTNIPLSGGEHLYTRMEVEPLLRKNIFDIVQSDPEWCGGITEAVRVGELCDLFGVKYIPHGHQLMPCLHTVASMAPDVSPYVEYLLNSIYRKTIFYKRNPLGADGLITLNETPGLGQDIDWDRVISHEQLTNFSL